MYYVVLENPLGARTMHLTTDATAPLLGAEEGAKVISYGRIYQYDDKSGFVALSDGKFSAEQRQADIDLFERALQAPSGCAAISMELDDDDVPF